MARMRTSSALELLVPLDRDGPEPLHRQLEQGIREADPQRPAGGRRGPAVDPGAGRAARRSRAGSWSRPTSSSAPRAISRAAGRRRPVSRSCRGRRPARARAGAGHRLRRRLPAGPARPRPLPARHLAALGPAGARRPPRASGSAISTAAAMPELRGALADYLNRVRGTAADADSIVVCSGLRAGPQARRRRSCATAARVGSPSRIRPSPRTATDLRATRSRGRRDPGRRRRGCASSSSTRAASRPRCLTAAHQYPTGGVLPAERRAALIAWAERRRGLVIEDDYDAEFRYDREPIGAMQGLAPDRVVYAGSASKILAPGLRLGWIVVPAELADAVAAAKKAADLGLARHRPARVRRLPRPRRARPPPPPAAADLPGAPRRPAGGARAAPARAPAGRRVRRVARPRLAAARPGRDRDHRGGGAQRDPAPGCRAPPARGRSRPTGEEPVGGLIFGYGTLGERALEPAVERLAAVIERVRGGAGAPAAPSA